MHSFTASLYSQRVTSDVQVVSGSGAVEHSQLVELSEKAFSKLPSTPLTASDLVKQVHHPRRPERSCPMSGNL